MSTQPHYPSRLRRRVAAFAAAVALTGSLIAPSSPAVAYTDPGNDDFAQATVVPGMATGFKGSLDFGDDNDLATKEAGEPRHGGNAGGSSLWYRWTAPVDATANLRSLNFDRGNTTRRHALAVYTGSSVDALSPVASQINVNPSFSWNAVAGTTYSIAIDRVAALPPGGRYFLGLLAVAVNDDFASAAGVTGVSGSVIGDIGNATREDGEPVLKKCCQIGSVWYEWTAPSSGSMTFDTAGSGINTQLGIYTRRRLAVLHEVASNDDCGDPRPRTSCVTFDSVAGTTYKIFLSGSSVFTSPFELHWFPEPA